LRRAFYACIYCMWLHFQSPKLRWLGQTKVITLKTQLHAVNARWKRQSQRSFNVITLKPDCIDQCFSTGGPQRSLSRPPNFSQVFSNRKFIHNYYKFYKTPTQIFFYLCNEIKIIGIDHIVLVGSTRIVRPVFWRAYSAMHNQLRGTWPSPGL